jgi:Trp operon repressor
MNRQAPQQPTPVAIAPALQPASTPAEARKLAEGLMDVMNALLTLIERETALVRVGNVREAIKLEAKKTELSRRYTATITVLKASQKYLAQVTPELLATLHRHHDVFRAMLQVNLTVLATAHAVSEGIVRGVNTEMQRRNIPQTYTASGVRAVPGPRNMTPIALSRSL